MDVQKFSKYVFPLTWLYCDVEKKGGDDYEIVNQRETGLSTFNISVLGLKIGFGPTDFKYFIDIKDVSLDDEFFEGVETIYLVKCNFKYVLFFIPIGITIKLGKIQEPEPWML